MFHNSTPAPDTALPDYVTVPSVEAEHIELQHRDKHRTGTAPLTPHQAGTRSAASALTSRGAHGVTDPADVEITAISPTEWRIAAQAIEHDDPNALLGFIQIVGTAFEVTNLGRPRERAYFTSFDRATASLLPREVLA